MRTSDFGIVGDGVTNNSAALRALRDAIAGPTHHTVEFPPGHYLYDDNRWLVGVERVTLIGNGAKFQNTCTSAWDRDRYPLYTGDPFTEPLGSKPHTGYRFESAEAGSSSIVMAETQSFAVGNRVLLHWCDQQFAGYPPNARYFEWNEVKAVGAETLTLKLPLRHSYSSDWTDINGCGKARIVNLDRPGYRYPRYIEFRDLEFLGNPNATDFSNGLFVPSERWVLSGVKHHGHCWPTVSRWVAIHGCDIASLGDIDKLVDHVEIKRSTVRSRIGAATGVNTLLLEDNHVYGHLFVCPRKLVARRNTFILPAGHRWGAFLHREQNYVEHYEACDNTVVSDGSLLHLVNDIPDSLLRLTVDAIGASGEMHFVDDSTARVAMRRIQVGGLYWAASGKGSITRQYFDGAEWVLEGTVPVAAGEAPVFGNCGRYVVEHNDVIGAVDIPTFRIGRDLAGEHG